MFGRGLANAVGDALILLQVEFGRLVGLQTAMHLLLGSIALATPELRLKSSCGFEVCLGIPSMDGGQRSQCK